ncbi:MAG: hypothetical protein Q4G33_08755 [bacterium]|nr:hypothetical protein [bacterium]
MAGKKKWFNMSLDEKIEAITIDIDNLSEQLKKKKKTLKELNVEKQAEENKKLLQAISDSGMSIDEVISLISENN